MSLKRILIAAGIAVVVAAIALGGSALYAWRTLNEPLPIAADGMQLTVESGDTLSRVARRLHNAGVLEHPRLLSAWGRISGVATQIKAGEFRVPPQVSAIELVDLLVTGSVVQYSFTIIEGWRFSEMLAALREHEAIELTGLADDQVMAALGNDQLHPEGQFLPDTYHFPRGTTERDVLARAHEALQAVLDEAWAQRSADVAVDDAYEALILASIIEKETGLAQERGQIAGVFSRRLQQGMRLQADPTVIYGLGEDWDGDIRRRDLTTDTPYNTYTRHGLPPTPIALAGRSAILAAVSPQPGDSLYFVATGEPDRSHYFSATLEEHNAAVQSYLQRLRQRDNPQ